MPPIIGGKSQKWISVYHIHSTASILRWLEINQNVFEMQAYCGSSAVFFSFTKFLQLHFRVLFCWVFFLLLLSTKLTYLLNFFFFNIKFTFSFSVNSIKLSDVRLSYIYIKLKIFNSKTNILVVICKKRIVWGSS